MLSGPCSHADLTRLWHAAPRREDFPRPTQGTAARMTDHEFLPRTPARSERRPCRETSRSSNRFPNRRSLRGAPASPSPLACQPCQSSHRNTLANPLAGILIRRNRTPRQPQSHRRDISSLGSISNSAPWHEIPGFTLHRFPGHPPPRATIRTSDNAETIAPARKERNAAIPALCGLLSRLGASRGVFYPSAPGYAPFASVCKGLRSHIAT